MKLSEVQKTRPSWMRRDVFRVAAAQPDAGRLAVTRDRDGREMSLRKNGMRSPVGCADEADIVDGAGEVVGVAEMSDDGWTYRWVAVLFADQSRDSAAVSAAFGGHVNGVV